MFFFFQIFQVILNDSKLDQFLILFQVCVCNRFELGRISRSQKEKKTTYIASFSVGASVLLRSIAHATPIRRCVSFRHLRRIFLLPLQVKRHFARSSTVCTAYSLSVYTGHLQHPHALIALSTACSAGPPNAPVKNVQFFSPTT